MNVNNILVALFLSFLVAVLLTIIMLGVLLWQLNHTLRRIETFIQDKHSYVTGEGVQNSEKNVSKEIHEIVNREVHEIVHSSIYADACQDAKSHFLVGAEGMQEENCTDFLNRAASAESVSAVDKSRKLINYGEHIEDSYLIPENESVSLKAFKDDIEKVEWRIALVNPMETMSWGFKARFAEKTDGNLVITAIAGGRYYVEPFVKKVSEKEYKYAAFENCFEFSEVIVAGALYKIMNVIDVCIMVKKNEFYEVERKGKVQIQKLGDF